MSKTDFEACQTLIRLYLKTDSKTKRLKKYAGSYNEKEIKIYHKIVI